MPETDAWLIEAVTGGDVVTVNKRLARELRDAYDAHQVAQGLRSWHTPRILPWSAWAGSLLDRCAATGGVPLRISQSAAGVVWERLLRKHAGDRVLNVHSLARQAQQAWQRLNDWCVPLPELLRSADSDDERLFAGIAADYRRTLEQNGWLDPAGFANLIAVLVRDGKIATPGRVTLAGFDRVVPAVDTLLQALRESGAGIGAAPGTLFDGATVGVARLLDADAELRTAGGWARDLLERDPQTSIAIVCPGLEQRATRAARLVREGLVPGWQYSADGQASAVNVSYGRRLAEYPLVSVALLWLGWACRGLPTRDISVLLRSPFAGRARTEGRCRLEMKLRSLPDRSWRPARLAAALQRHASCEDAVDWLARVNAVATVEAGRSRLASPAVWAERIDSLLQAVGWPGEGVLDSGEFQLQNRWRELLNELSGLEVVAPRIDLAGAVSRLTLLAGDTVYQPEAGPGAVRLLGTLEAAGLAFDHLWFCHLDAQQWPPSAHALSLVSKSVQRKYGMPDATPADTLAFSRTVLKRLTTSAPHVVLSWPATDQDVPLEASPLLASFEAGVPAPAADPGWHAASLACSDPDWRQPQDTVPAILPGEKVTGGSSVVQRQLQEPFSAFAYGRLGIRELQSIETGLPARIRGNIIHDALQRLLSGKPSSGEMATWGEEAGQRVEDAVDAALERHRRFADGVLLRLLALERQRLRLVLQDFLQSELRRLPFRVLSLEEPIDLERHGVALRLRADRIDRLDDGSLLIIDYKTGAPKSLLDRSGEPRDYQLVIYAMAIGDTVGGLSLINLDSRGIVYRGAGGSLEWDRSPSALWPSRLDAWRQRADTALLQFSAGDVRLNIAQVAAKRRPLGLLSRVEELRRGL